MSHYYPLILAKFLKNLLNSVKHANAFSDIVIQTVYCYLGRDIVILSASEESFDGIGPFYL